MNADALPCWQLMDLQLFHILRVSVGFIFVLTDLFRVRARKTHALPDIAIRYEQRVM